MKNEQAVKEGLQFLLRTFADLGVESPQYLDGRPPEFVDGYITALRWVLE